MKANVVEIQIRDITRNHIKYETITIWLYNEGEIIGTNYADEPCNIRFDIITGDIEIRNKKNEGFYIKAKPEQFIGCHFYEHSNHLELSIEFNLKEYNKKLYRGAFDGE